MIVYTEWADQIMGDTSYRGRRAMALYNADQTEGYETPSLGPNIGRVIMNRNKYGPWQPGFYPLDHPQFGNMERHYKAKHKKATMELPK